MLFSARIDFRIIGGPINQLDIFSRTTPSTVSPYSTVDANAMGEYNAVATRTDIAERQRETEPD
ncbi:hypothetical protein ECMP0209401_2738 [Escherichia coli MP020940.1]|nr:hypothetical protein ECMP0209401_2738 [Escherichia coli MP020940.1]MDW9199358.1 hypothetical protein [Escherichia coli]